MGRFVLWVEGVDFGATLLDTNDISTMRGASLALLEAPEWAEQFLRGKGVNVERIFTGASLGAFVLEGERSTVEAAKGDLERGLAATGDDPESVRRAAKAADEAARRTGSYAIETLPFAHLRFVCGLAEIVDRKDKLALQEAKSRAQASRYRGEARRAPLTPAERPCRKDRMRPADSFIKVPTDDPDGVTDDDSRSATLAVSRSVAARRHFGRHMRQAFYLRHLSADTKSLLHPDRARFPAIGGLTFADSFLEVVKLHDDQDWERYRQQFAIPSEGVGFRPSSSSLNSKIAIFYADGNKFTDIRREICNQRGEFEGLRLFATTLLGLQSRELLTPILESFIRSAWSRDRAASERIAYFCPRDRVFKLRLETLLWGGDEVKFVMPAWLGWVFARRFFDVARGWTVDGHRLTFSAGLLFCNYKTPIREVRGLARALGDMAKDAGARNSLEVEVLESIEPPIEGIDGLRERLTGLQRDSTKLVIPGDGIGAMTQRILALKDEAGAKHLPRSQVYGMLRGIHKSGATLATGGSVVRKEFDTYQERPGTEAGRELALDDLYLTPECADEAALGLNMYRLSQLWDYVTEDSGVLPTA